MKKYFLIGGPVTFAVIFNLGYVFHEIIMGDFFKRHIGAIQRESYIIPLIALAFTLYTAFQAYFLPVYFEYTSRNYNWGLSKTAIIFGAVTGFFWDGLQGGVVRVGNFEMLANVLWYNPTYHTAEGILTASLLATFYKRFPSRE